MAVYTGKINLINMSAITANVAVGIQRTEVLYAISSSNSIPPDLEDVELTTENGIISFASTGASFQIIDDIVWIYQGDQTVPLTVNKDDILVSTSIWSPYFPEEIGEGMYLWTKVTYYYTNGDSTTVFNVSKQGEKGEQGPAGSSVTSFRLECNQTEILKFIDGSSGKTSISPSILTVSVVKDDPLSDIGFVQIDNLNKSKFSIQIYDVGSGYWYSITDSEIVSLDNNVFNINLQSFIDKTHTTEDDSYAAKEIRESECIIKIAYELTQTNINNETEYFNIVEFLNVRFGMNKDMASLNVKASGIVAAMQDSKMVFDGAGLTLQNGAFKIVKTTTAENGSSTITPLLYADELGNLVLKGTVYAESGSFKGHIEATSGTFSGELNAATGTFEGELKGASGSFSGDISAATGTIGGFRIESNRLVSTDNEFPNIILNGENGSIYANNITLGEGAVIEKYLKIGEQVYLNKVDNQYTSFISVQDGSNNEILALIADGTMKIGNGVNTIILSGADGSITSQSYADGLGWKISNTNSIFNDVTVKGSIRASVLEYGEVQAIGGAILVRPSTRILSVRYTNNNNNDYTILTLEEIRDFKAGDYCRIDVQSSNQIGAVYYTIMSVDINQKTVTFSGKLPDVTGKPIVNFGQSGDNIGISINGSTDESFCLPRSITVFEFDSDNTRVVPRLILGRLPDQKDLYGFAAGTYGLYAENVLLKGSLVTQTRTGDSEVMYSGISTVYSGNDSPRSTKLSSKMSGHTPSEILLWAGAQGDNPEAIEASKFFVDRNGNMYAGSGYFEGTIITDATITASAIETAILRGVGAKPALTIEDAKNGIDFTTFEDNILPLDINNWENYSYEGKPGLITKEYLSVQKSEKYSLKFGTSAKLIRIFYSSDGSKTDLTIEGFPKDFVSFIIPEGMNYAKIEVEGYESLNLLKNDFNNETPLFLKKYKTVFQVTHDSIVANVPNFVFNGGLTIEKDGSLAVPNLYIVGQKDTYDIGENGLIKSAIAFENKRINYIKDFNQGELNGVVEGYIDFSEGIAFSPDGGDKILALSSQKVVVKGNSSLYIENSVIYGECVEYRPVKNTNGVIIGYDLYVE